MITALIFAAALVGGTDQTTPTAAQDANTVEGLTVMSRPKSASADLTDRVIEDQLFQLWESQPERMVCAQPPATGTRMPKPVCGTLDRWFNARRPEDVVAKRAPWQLVEEIKKNKRKASARRS